MALQKNTKSLKRDQGASVVVSFKLNKQADADILAKLNSLNNRNQFFKNLMRRVI